MPLSARARSAGSASQTSARSSAIRSPPGFARTRLDLEQRQREPLALLGKSARRGRESFELGERVLERGEALPRQARLLAQRLAPGVPDLPREERLGAQPLGEPGGRLPSQLKPFRSALQTVERRGRALALPRRPGELLLDAVPLDQQRLDALVDPLPPERGRR